MKKGKIYLLEEDDNEWDLIWVYETYQEEGEFYATDFDFLASTISWSQQEMEGLLVDGYDIGMMPYRVQDEKEILRRVFKAKKLYDTFETWRQLNA